MDAATNVFRLLCAHSLQPTLKMVEPPLIIVYKLSLCKITPNIKILHTCVCISFLAGDIRAVTNATTCVTDWSTMGIELDIPIEVIDKSNRDSRHITNDHQRILLTYWLESGNASWAALVNALRSSLVAKGGQANKIAKEHPSE